MKNTITKAVMVALLGLGAATTYAADPATTGRHGHALSQEERAAKLAAHQARFAAMVAKHQAALHDQLKLSAAQEPAWQTFVAAVTPTLPMRREHSADAAATTPERLDQHLTMAKQHLAKMETRAAATKVFYGQLTPEQQKTFDAAAAKMHRGMAHRHMMHRGGM
ncbi:MAG: Spy/CpxP family protein refolding chaperone [Burkholderiaceae bacterium]|nr:Spy/CpxP family protein refolding chaperone [Burkholderiaceae bacterium]